MSFRTFDAGRERPEPERMLNIKIHRLCLILSILFGTIGCDHLTKSVVRMQVQYTQNPGAFMSLGAQLSPELRFWMFEISVSFFLLLVAWALIRARSLAPAHVAGLSFVLAGGLGNLIDRLNHGSVTDFLILSWGNYHTGIFNLADMAICLGALLLFIPRSNPGYS
jgi:signal peptidase II